MGIWRGSHVHDIRHMVPDKKRLLFPVVKSGTQPAIWGILELLFKCCEDLDILKMWGIQRYANEMKLPLLQYPKRDTCWFLHFYDIKELSLEVDFNSQTEKTKVLFFCSSYCAL